MLHLAFRDLKLLIMISKPHYFPTYELPLWEFLDHIVRLTTSGGGGAEPTYLCPSNSFHNEAHVESPSLLPKILLNSSTMISWMYSTGIVFTLRNKQVLVGPWVLKPVSQRAERMQEVCSASACYCSLITEPNCSIRSETTRKLQCYTAQGQSFF